MAEWCKPCRQKRRNVPARMNLGGVPLCSGCYASGKYQVEPGTPDPSGPCPAKGLKRLEESILEDHADGVTIDSLAAKHALPVGQVAEIIKTKPQKGFSKCKSNLVEEKPMAKKIKLDDAKIIREFQAGQGVSQLANKYKVGYGKIRAVLGNTFQSSHALPKKKGRGAKAKTRAPRSGADVAQIEIPESLLDRVWQGLTVQEKGDLVGGRLAELIG